MNKKIGLGSSIGKIILMGEHSVVYGKPAIAIPFLSARINARVYEDKGQVNLTCFSYKGPLLDTPENLLGLKELIKKLIRELGEDLNAFNIDIESTIPSERGMGSSAAVAAATVRAVYNYFNKDLDKETLTAYVNYSEKIVHGNPSGIDTAIVVGERPLYYIKDRPLERFHLKMDAFLIVADTGQKGRTKFAVAGVKKFLDDKPEKGKDIIACLGELVDQARVTIKDDQVEELGRLMNQAQGLLGELGVSNERIESLVGVALDKGALGAKLTGGGLGGCIIGLTSDRKKAEDISAALIKHGAKDTWILNMGGKKDEG